MESSTIAMVIMVLSFIFVTDIIIFVYFFPIHVFILARTEGIQVNPRHIMRLRMAKVDPGGFVQTLIGAKKENLTFGMEETSRLVEATVQGLPLQKILGGLKYARKKGVSLSVEKAINMASQGIDIESALFQGEYGTGDEETVYAPEDIGN